MKRWTLIAVLAAVSICWTTQANAQPRVGETMPEFELQATDGKFYGSKNANGKVSIYFFVGYN